MSTVDEIVQAIGNLPREEFWKLTDQIVEQREKIWDTEIADDAGAGRLDALWQQAEAEIARGDTMPIDDFLRHQDLPG
jgi:hypothetical protein